MVNTHAACEHEAIVETEYAFGDPGVCSKGYDDDRERDEDAGENYDGEREAVWCEYPRIWVGGTW